MITVEPFGRVGDRQARAFRIHGDGRVSALVTDYGARLVQLHVPDRAGVTADVVLGFDRVEDYRTSPAYFGATVGRYGNRITRGRFPLGGRHHQVDVNEGRNHLHGGSQGWDSRLWDAEASDGTSVTFRTTSADGDMGFPGACAVTSTYSVEGDGLRIVMTAVPDATTVINMVHHSYFNLAGHDSGTILDQRMRLAGDFYVPVDGELMPTGEILAVAGTPFDFRQGRPIGARLAELPPVGAEIFTGGGGYDHNWCLREHRGHDLVEAADIVEPASGRRLWLRTTEPGVQMYTAGYLDGTVAGKGGHRYPRYAGFTLETQIFPDAPNVAHFPSAVVRAGETYRHEMFLDLAPLR